MIGTLDFDSLTLIFFLYGGRLCLIAVSTHKRPSVYSVSNIKCTEWRLFLQLQRMVLIIMFKKFMAIKNHISVNLQREGN